MGHRPWPSFNVTFLAAIILATLPRRHWCRFDDRFPLLRAAWLSGLAAMLGGLAVGITGYIAFVTEAADGAALARSILHAVPVD